MVAILMLSSAILTGLPARSYAKHLHPLTCDQLRAKVPNRASVLFMSKSQRNELKQFLVDYEANLKACMEQDSQQLLKWLK